MPNIWGYAAIGGIVAVLTFILSAGERLKGFMGSITNLWMEKINLDNFVQMAVYRYCIENMAMVGLRKKSYAGCIAPMKGTHREHLIAFDRLNTQPIWFRSRWKFLILSPGEWSFCPELNDCIRTIDLLMPRLMWNPRKFVMACLDSYNKSVPNGAKRFAIRYFHGKNKNLMIDLGEKRPNTAVTGLRNLIRETAHGRASMLNYSMDDLMLDAAYEGSPFDWYAFPKDTMEFVDNVRQWFRSKQWYKDKRIPWRRGGSFTELRAPASPYCPNA